MNKTVSFFISIILLIISTATVGVHANDDAKPLDQDKNNFYKSAALSVRDKIRKAMPTAPVGWTASDEVKIDSFPDPESDGINQYYRFSYQIHYKRLAGIKEEKKRLAEVYAESSERHGEEVNAQIDDLLRQQTVASEALRKASRRKNVAEIQRLNNELEENGRKMRAIHEDVEDKISRDVGQYLLKDTEAVINIVVNNERAEDVYGDPLTVSEAAFAFRREGERKGPTTWQEGKTIILYGDWQQVGFGVFRGHLLPGPNNPKAQTICITITGARNRAVDLMNQMDSKAILSLMK